MTILSFQARYRLYGEWEKETEQNPIVLAARQTAKVIYLFVQRFFSNLSLNVKFIHNHPSFLLNQLDTRRLLKRLAKENLKPLGRMVAKLAHANPMTVLRTIVQQVCAT